jgi:DNA adenine methylase
MTTPSLSARHRNRKGQQLTEIPIVLVPKSRNRHSQNAVSPFRYPGGKAFLAPLIDRVLNALGGLRHIAEPFCGGAGASLNLLADGSVDRVSLNDADLRIFSSWKAMLSEPERFCERLRNCALTMDEWYQHQNVAASSFDGYDFELGFSTFYMNRTTRSGIVERSGPIGGYDQATKWKLSARFNREKLVGQVQWLASKSGCIELYNLDALNFVKSLRGRHDAEDVFLFVDPPYVKAGGRLYFNGMTEAKHIALSDMIRAADNRNWLVTYDDHKLIRSLYGEEFIAHMAVVYSLQDKRREKELLILPQQCSSLDVQSSLGLQSNL